MMDFLNWGSEHPVLFVLTLMAFASACHGIGGLFRK